MKMPVMEGEGRVNNNLIQFNPQRISDISTVLSQKVTALALLLKESKNSKSKQEIGKEIEKYLKLLLVEVCECNVGIHFKRHLERIANSLLEAIQNLIKSSQNNQSEINQLTGVVWESCQQLMSEKLPQSNEIFVGNYLDSIVEMLKDAVAEATQTQSGIDFDGQVLEISTNDKEFISSCIALVNTSILCLKKAKNVILKASEDQKGSAGWIQDLDGLITTANDLSAFTDDLICLLDIPLDIENPELQSSSLELSKSCKKVFDFIEKESLDIKWIDLCSEKLKSFRINE